MERDRSLPTAEAPGRWEGVEALLVDSAKDDLDSGGEVVPALVAFSGARLRFVAWLRPFVKGAYHDPITELLALAMPLDADRLALSFSGRAWSLEDPVPPVTPDADLRQRVLIVHLTDGSQGSPRSRSVLHPFDVPADGGASTWRQPTRLAGAEGWIPDALELAVRQRGRLRADDREIFQQACRVVQLGHDLHCAPDLTQRLLAQRPG